MSNSKKLGDVVMISPDTWNINNKTHLNSINRKRDTLCGKNFSNPNSDTDLIIYREGEFFKLTDGFADVKIQKDALCQRCVKVFLTNS